MEIYFLHISDLCYTFKIIFLMRTNSLLISTFVLKKYIVFNICLTLIGSEISQTHADLN